MIILLCLSLLLLRRFLLLLVLLQHEELRAVGDALLGQPGGPLGEGGGEPLPEVVGDDDPHEAEVDGQCPHESAELVLGPRDLQAEAGRGRLGECVVVDIAEEVQVGLRVLRGHAHC